MHKIVARVIAVAVATLMLTGCVNTTPVVDVPPKPVADRITVTPPAGEPIIDESPSTPDAPAGSEPPTGVSTAPVVAKTWWQEGFLEKFYNNESPSCGDSVARCIVYDDVSKLAKNASFDKNPADVYEFNTRLITDTATEVDDLGVQIMPNVFFEIIALDDTKYTGELYEKGVTIARSLPSQNKDKTVKLAVAKEDYDQLLARVEATLTNTANALPSWIAMTRVSRLSSATVTMPSGVAKTYARTADGELPWQLRDLRSAFIDTRYDMVGVGQPTALKLLPNAAEVEFNFNNGLVYNIYVNDSQLLVVASGVDTALLYESKKASYINEQMEMFASGRVNPNTGKPVIYLYPERSTDCTVTVDYDSFTYTYPTYNKGWSVTAHPDGRLINKADGSEHYYLFWEGNKRVDWRFDSGFVVAGSDVESFLRDKLAYMGLTPREYNDFITYWVPRMQDNKYNLITFAGEQYEQLAPLTVTPAPDSVLRVHMVYKAIDKPVAIPEQTLTKFTRRGFTVVEWGGSVTG